jgi:hypothetical protein
MEQFNYIQSFIIRKDTVGGASKVLVTSLDLYFKNKPNIQNNKSGIVAPTVHVYICPFNGENPNPDVMVEDVLAYAEYNSIPVVADASAATRFTFQTPIAIDTDKYYGIVVKFDDQDYQLFTAIQNETILNTTQKYSGTSGEGDGKLYVDGGDDTLKPLSDQDLKFELRIAQFTSNTVTVEITNDDFEFFTCNNMSTALEFGDAELIFTNYGKVANASVNTFFSRAGTVKSLISNNIIVGTNTTFTTDYQEDDYLVLTNTSNTEQQDIVRIASIRDDTTIDLENGVRFSNTCWHNKVMTGQLAKVSYVSKSIYLRNSSAANSTVRFHTNSVHYFTISNPGGNYSNTNTIRVSNGSVNATGVLVTNATGNVVAIRMISAGGGFPNASHSVTTITTATGSGASIVPVINTPLKAEISRATADLVSIDNVPIEILDPELDIFSTSVTTANVTYSIANTSGYMQPFTAADLSAPIKLPYNGAIFSRSNELKTPTNLYNNDKSAVMRVNIGVKNTNVNNSPTFGAPYFYDFDLNIFTFSGKIGPTNANTDGEIGRGSQQSKHITSKIILANNAFAEDIRVFINAYKPANTKILVYAKIHNSQDSEAFDDKSWSPLEIVSGENLISASGNRDDIKEFQYGFPRFPESQFTCSGAVTTELSNNVILTTTDLSSNLAVNDLVKVYNPLFSTTNYLVTAVDSVNSTAVILNDAVSNSGLVGSALKIDKLKFKNVAYNNVLNDNVVRYFTTSMSPVDAYDSVAIKMVFLADVKAFSPEVDDIRVIAVSA